MSFCMCRDLAACLDSRIRVQHRNFRLGCLLIHLPDQGVDVLLSVAQVTTFDEVLELSRAEATGRI